MTPIHPCSSKESLPLIGISAHAKDGMSCLNDAYVQSVVQAGGAPVILPVTADVAATDAIVSSLDGLILSGGGDIDPVFLGEEPVPELDGVNPLRDAFDFHILQQAFDRQLPILGICRGHQVIQVAFGGTMYQDIATQFPAEKTLPHSQTEPRDCATHTVIVAPAPSVLRRIAPDKDTWDVNSLHHQAVKSLAPGFVAVATSPDGVNEAAELPEYRLFSVQWHPEQMAVKEVDDMSKIFRFHERQARTFACAKELHRHILTLDSHVDTPMVYDGAFDIDRPADNVFRPPFTQSKTTLRMMEQGRLDAVCMAVYIPQGERTEAGSTRAWEYTLERLSQIARQAELHPTRLGIAHTPDDLYRLKRAGRKALVPAVENGYAIGKDLLRLNRLKAAGVAYMTLCHNGANDICDSSAGASEWNGLSPFGAEVVRRMNRLGMMVDVSHASEKTFYDVLSVSRAPVIASHSAVRALCNHPRNLTDDQIRALAAGGGVVQLCLYTGFIRENSGETGCPEATLSDAMRHIDHMVGLVGVDHVGIGSDFDGGGELIGCRAANELIQITVRLLEKGYTDNDIRKIWGGNLLRVMRTTQAGCPEKTCDA